MSAHLRKAFRYPSNDEDSSSRNPDEELDDEQQEAVVKAIRDHDEKTIQIYKTLFTVLPIAAVVFFLPSLFRWSGRSSSLIALLATTSLASTAYTMWFIPVFKDFEPMGGVTGRRQRALYAGLDTPVAKYLPWMNGGVAAILAIFGILFWSRAEVPQAIWALVPGTIYVVVMVARHDLVPLDLSALERSRYEFKGA